jgi:hypothetical protein
VGVDFERRDCSAKALLRTLLVRLQTCACGEN